MIKFRWIFITNQPVLIGAFLFLLIAQSIAFGINKALSIPLQGLRAPKAVSGDSGLPFVAACGPGGPGIYGVMDKSV